MRGRRDAGVAALLERLSIISIVTTSPALSRRSSCVASWKPSPCTSNEYDPGGRSTERNTPSAFVEIVRTVPVARLVRVISAPTTPRAETSRMIPWTAAVVREAWRGSLCSSWGANAGVALGTAGKAVSAWTSDTTAHSFRTSPDAPRIQVISLLQLAIDIARFAN